MKKLTLKNLNAYHRLSVEEKRQVVGGGLIDTTCLSCAPGYVTISDHCYSPSCKSCNEFPPNYPLCQEPTEIIFPTDPTDFPVDPSGPELSFPIW